MTSFLNQSNNSVHPPKNETCTIDDPTLRIPLAFCYSLIFIFGLGGNLLALWVFFFVHGKKNSVRIFLINIAIADLLMVICLPFRVAYHINLNNWSLGPIFCKVVGNVFYMNMYISITLLGLISLDRYVKVYQAAGGRHLKNSTWSIVICGIIWTLSIITTIPMAVPSEDSNNQKKCFQYSKRQGAEWKAYINCFLVALFWLVFLSLVTSYGKIAFKLLGNYKQNPDFPNALKYNRTAKKSFFILLIFTICFVPYHAFRSFYIHSQIHETTCSWAKLMDRTNEIVLLFSAFNSCLDPVMYFLLSGSVRKTTIEILSNFFHSVAKQSKSTSGSSESCRPSMPPPRPSEGQAVPSQAGTTVESSVLNGKLVEDTSSLEVINQNNHRFKGCSRDSPRFHGYLMEIKPLPPRSDKSHMGGY